MIKKFIDNLSKSKKEREYITRLNNVISKQRIGVIKKLLTEKRINVLISKEKVFGYDVEFPYIETKDKNIDVSAVNNDILRYFNKRNYLDFSKKVLEEFSKKVAPNIMGMDYAKKAAVIQLFSKQAIHIMLLGDPGTGKTDIIRAVADFAPISSFGLGSGTSGVGLIATVKGNKVMKGLLPLANKGICCIDELNLMTEDSRAGLYNAMEKGFVTYDKGGHHHKFDAKVKVLATANPKGDEFKGKNIEELKKQMPFDPALLTRFHLVFLIRKPDLDKFKKIAGKILSQETTEVTDAEKQFLKGYISYVEETIKEVDFPKPQQQKVIDIVDSIKQREKDYLVEINPRLVIGFMRLCKGLARMQLRSIVRDKDIALVKEILETSLNINFDH